MTEERFERLLRAAAREHNRAPRTPREEIWARIVAARREGAGEPHGPRLDHRRWWPAVAAAAAALAMGIVIGREGASVGLDRQGPAGQNPIRASQETAQAPGSEERRAALYAQAATPYLSRVEALLTMVRGADSEHRTAVPISAWAEDLLAETRLFLDSPAQRDEGLRLLLTDLEFVLAQIVLLSDRTPARDSEWIHDSIQQRSIMGRLRGRIPSGQSGSGA